VILANRPPVRLEIEWVQERLVQTLERGAILAQWLDEHGSPFLTPFGRTFYGTMRNCFAEACAQSAAVLKTV